MSSAPTSSTKPRKMRQAIGEGRWTRLALITVALIFLGLMVVRLGARFALKDSHEVGGIPVNVIIDGLTLFYAGNIVGMQVDVWMRARKLLADAIAAKAAGQTVPAEMTQDRGGETAHG